MAAVLILVAAVTLAGAGAPAPAGADIVASLNQLQREARRTRAQMVRLNAEMQVIAQKWEQARKHLDVVNGRLGEARRQLDRNRTALDAQRELVAGRMATMYKTGDYTWLDFVTSSSSLADMETVMDFMRRIELQDRTGEARLQELTGQSRKLEHDVEGQHQDAVAAQLAIDDERNAMDQKLAERTAMLKDLTARIKKILSAPLLLMKAGGKVTQITWAQALLKSLNMPMTADNVAAIVAWEMAEGGHWYNTAFYNPLNTTQSMPGATVFNSVGVKAYTSWLQGLKATVITLHNGYYAGILAALGRGNDSQAVADAVASSPWGTGSFNPQD